MDLHGVGSTRNIFLILGSSLNLERPGGIVQGKEQSSTPLCIVYARTYGNKWQII